MINGVRKNKKNQQPNNSDYKMAQLLHIQNSGLFPLLQNATQIAKVQKGQIEKFIEIANNPNVTQRKLNAEFFFSELNTYMSFSEFVSLLGIHFINKNIPYHEFCKKIEQLQYNIQSLSAGDQSEAQLQALTSAKEALKQELQASESFLLKGLKKITTWQILMSQNPNQKDKHIILCHMFQDLPQILSLLIERFMSSEFYLENHFFYLQAIQENSQHLIDYAEDYHTALITTTTFPFESSIDVLMCAFRNVILVFHSLGLGDKAKEAQAKTEVLIKNFPPSMAKNDFQQEYDQAEKYSKILAIQDKFLFFKTLFDFYVNHWQNNSLEDPEEIDQEKFQENLLTQLQTFNSLTRLMPTNFYLIQIKYITIYLMTYKRIPPSQLTRETVSTVLKLLMALMKFLELVPLEQRKIFHLTSMGIVKKIASDVTSLLVSMPEPAMDNLTKSFKNLNLKLDEEAKELRAQMLKKESSENNLLLSQEKSKLKVEYEQRHNALREQIEEERKAYQEKLAQENAKALLDQQNSYNNLLAVQKSSKAAHLLSIESEHKSELAIKKRALQKTHAANIEKLNLEHQKQIEQLAKKNTHKLNKFRSKLEQELNKVKTKQTQELKSLTDKYGAELKNINIEHQNDLKTQKTQHDESLNNLKKTQQTTLETTKKQNQSDLETARKQYKTELDNAKNAHESKLATLRKEYETELETAKNLQASKLELIKEQSQTESDSLKSQHQAQLATVKTVQENELATAQKKPIANTTPINPLKDVPILAKMEIPCEHRFILQTLQEAGIEFYIVGGFVRKQVIKELMAISLPCDEDDIDIMVNCHVDNFPNQLKQACHQNLLRKKQLKLGRLDFWCSPWEDLSLELDKRDFSLNTFICTLQGNVFDLKNAKQDLYSPYIRFMGEENLDQRLQEDPSLILRGYRFISEWGKNFMPKDLPIIHKNAQGISKLPLGVYLCNLKSLFISSFALINLAKFEHHGILSDVIPTMPSSISDHLNVQSSSFYSFMRSKIQEFNNNPKNHDSYHVLSLFLLIPLLSKVSDINELKSRLYECINRFFTKYQAKVQRSDKQKVKKAIEQIMLTTKHENSYHIGMYALFKQFEEQLHAEQQIKPAYLPYNQSNHYRAPQQSYKESYKEQSTKATQYLQKQ